MFISVKSEVLSMYAVKKNKQFKDPLNLKKYSVIQL